MTGKTLEEMTLSELYQARERAALAVQSAEYQESLRAWRDAKDTATWWSDQVEGEIGRRLAAIRKAAWREHEEKNDGR